MVTSITVLVQHHGDLQEPFEPDRQVIQELEEFIGVVELPQFMKPTKPVVDESPCDVDFLTEPKVLPEVGSFHW